MSIEVKRHCSSSVRNTPDRVTFGDFTIAITDEDAKKFHLLLDNLYEGWKLSDMLGDLIAEGINAALEVQEDA